MKPQRPALLKQDKGGGVGIKSKEIFALFANNKILIWENLRRGFRAMGLCGVSNQSEPGNLIYLAIRLRVTVFKSSLSAGVITVEDAAKCSCVLVYTDWYY